VIAVPELVGGVAIESVMAATTWDSSSSVVAATRTVPVVMTVEDSAAGQVAIERVAEIPGRVGLGNGP